MLYNQLVYNGLRFSYEGNNYKISLSEDLMKILLKIKKKCFEKILFQLKKISFEFEKKCLSKKSYFKMPKNYHFKQKFTIL